MACAGLLLSHAQNWSFLTQMEEAFVLIPPLLGLKGNLEMTLASRLGTWTNLGLLKTRKQQLKIFISSVALDQAQAIIVAFLAAIIASVIYKLGEGGEDVRGLSFKSSLNLYFSSLGIASWPFTWLLS